jgi:esterase/lipase superfamily enzyme
MLHDTREMQKIRADHDVPVWIDFWGFDVAHDWPWWRKQIVYFIPKVLAED